MAQARVKRLIKVYWKTTNDMGETITRFDDVSSYGFSGQVLLISQKLGSGSGLETVINLDMISHYEVYSTREAT